MQVTRRAFSAAALSAALMAATELARPNIARAQAGGRIVIIGGGPGGATVAVALKRAAPDLQITLVDARKTHPTCFYSNLYLGGFRTFDSLVQSYDGMRALGITVLHDMAVGVDPVARTVNLASSPTLAYDRLVLAPGIALKYDAIEGYSQEAAQMMPHAWVAGPQTMLLKSQLEAMPDGGTVVIAAPALPYRCPPAPYERACLIAHYLRGTKPKSKIILLDAKRTFTKQAVFEEAFASLYTGQIELVLSDEIDDNTVVKVDPGERTVTTRSGRIVKADVANIIPPQRAGDIARLAGCAQGDWCPVQLDSFRSALVPNVYVLGDAAISADMPKSAFSASSQARVVASHILAEMAGKPASPARYVNTCWSMLGPDNSAKIGATYTPGEKGGKPYLIASDPFVSKPGETAQVRHETFEESAAWYRSLTAEIYPPVA